MNDSSELHRAFRDASDRFDEFVLAALLAVCAYLAQSNPYAKLGFNAETVFLISLMLFVASAYFGFKRIEQVIVLYRINADYLSAKEKKDHVFANQALEVRPQIKEGAIFYYRCRNSLMFIGLGVYIAGKYWHVYS